MKKTTSDRAVEDGVLHLSQKDLLHQLEELVEAEQQRKRLIEEAEQKFQRELGKLNFSSLMDSEGKKLLGEKHERLKKAKVDAEAKAATMEKSVGQMVKQLSGESDKNFSKVVETLLHQILS